jgi:transcriptional regulator with XRE-family HTH domain
MRRGRQLTSTPGTPDEEEPIGVTLARMRHAMGLTGADLAARVNMSQPKISRIERGHGQPDPSDIGIIARALGAPEAQIQALVEQAERLHDGMTDWRPSPSGLAGRQKTIAGWESAANVLRIFEVALIPGPLQTSGYAKAVLRESWPFMQPTTDAMTEQALLAAVSARIRRQEALADRAKQFSFILSETVLKPRTFAAVEMLAQIDHLRDVLARHENVSIGVIRDGAPAPPPVHSFTLLDDNLVIVDLYNTGLTSRGRRDLESYRRVFDQLAEHATDIGPVLDQYHRRYVEMLRNP